MAGSIEPAYRRSTGLVDVLDRVLDKGLVVAGDVRVSLAEVELLTLRIRLLVCSIDKAEQIGLDWWRHDPHLSSAARKLNEENEDLRVQVLRLEERLRALEAPGGAGAAAASAAGAPRVAEERGEE
ncbi:MAG TPA: gas vesicle protein [Thermoanaerobaculia bacterium]|nr:gas vesicle protein [Thermoanaerobaculia bacterium]